MSKSKKTNKNIRLIHKWLGLILGIQVLFWVSGGVVMSLFPIEMVRGADRAVIVEPRQLDAADFIYPFTDVLIKFPKAEQVHADYWMGKAVYRVYFKNDELFLDALNGNKLSPISSNQASQVALADYSEPSSVLDVKDILMPQGEVRGREGQLWRVSIDDSRNTFIYVSKSTGKVVARRNDVWRLFDFFWMLHIMDYEDRDDFNNILLQGFAVSSLLFVISGLWLFFYSFRRKDFSWLIGKKKTDQDQGTNS